MLHEELSGRERSEGHDGLASQLGMLSERHSCAHFAHAFQPQVLKYSPLHQLQQEMQQEMQQPTCL